MANIVRNVYRTINYVNGHFLDIKLKKETEEYLESWAEDGKNTYGGVDIIISDREKMKNGGYVTLWKCRFYRYNNKVYGNRDTIYHSRLTNYRWEEDFDIDNAICMAYMSAVCNIQ